MLSKINPTKTNAWQLLEKHFQTMKEVQMKTLFEENKKRFQEFSISFEDFLFDYSKNIITEDTLSIFASLCEEVQLTKAIEDMFTGVKINETENRAVLHTALRAPRDTSIFIEEEDIMPAIQAVKEQMRVCCNQIHEGLWKGYTGKKIKYIVNIGIGGSDLGPYMVTEALKPYWKEDIQVYFVSNVDASHIYETLAKITPEETIFLIASKTFTTQETMTNAHTARTWFLQYAKEESFIAKHFIALSTNEKAVVAFGISPNCMFKFWDWVGGRYSLWSAIGLSIALTIGYDQFELLLQGAYTVDEHFRKSSWRNNIPVLMACLSIWYTHFFKAQSEAILPYDQYLHRFPAYLQQANMESNGKSVDRSGSTISYPTGPIVWGEPGTNGQHAFYQLIHQGQWLIPCDFIAAAMPQHEIGIHHQLLLSNFFAQTQALMNGRKVQEALVLLADKGYTSSQIKKVSAYQTFSGNKPSNSILIKKMTPDALGRLIALYEHKIFVQGVILNIFSFDQWGVELGKELAGTILPDLIDDTISPLHNSSTKGLIEMYKKWNNRK